MCHMSCRAVVRRRPVVVSSSRPRTTRAPLTVMCGCALTEEEIDSLPFGSFSSRFSSLTTADSWSRESHNARLCRTVSRAVWARLHLSLIHI